MNNLNWFNNSGTTLILHLAILVLAIFNFNYQFLVANIERENQLLEIQTHQIITNIEDLSAGSGFQSNSVFKNREIRNKGYKFAGETVIDTSIIEPILDFSGERRNYIPATVQESENQLQKWLDCLFYGVDKNQEEIIFCRY